MKTTLTIEYLRDGHWHVGQLREVPGVFSQGRNLAELHKNLRDAYRLVLKDQRPVRRKGGSPAPPRACRVKAPNSVRKHFETGDPTKILHVLPLDATRGFSPCDAP